MCLCSLACVLPHSGRHLCVRASESLSANAEVLNNYGPHRGHHTRAQRQQALAAEYHFVCGCSCCAASPSNSSAAAAAADKHDELEGTFRCIRSGCGGSMASTASAHRSSSSEPTAVPSLSCSTCGASAASEPLVQRQQELEGALEQAREWIEQAQVCVH